MGLEWCFCSTGASGSVPGEQSSWQKPCSGHRLPLALLKGGLLEGEEPRFPTEDRKKAVDLSEIMFFLLLN